MMMKSLVFALGALLFDLAAATNHEVFCGLEPCLIPLELSCERMMEDYVFQGA